MEFPGMVRALKNNGLDSATGALPTDIGEMLEIVSGGLDAHPWHANGSQFYNICSGSGVYNAGANELQLAYTNPIKRDTVILYRYALSTGNGTDAGWRAWRIRIMEPGVWGVDGSCTSCCTCSCKSIAYEE
jgi:hypothetical protein